jgi:hypothetical protein
MTGRLLSKNHLELAKNELQAITARGGAFHHESVAALQE